MKPVAITILGSEEKRRSCCVTILYMFIGIFSCFLLLAAISATAFIIIVSFSSSVLPSSSSTPSFASSSSSFAPAPSPSVYVSPDLPTPLVKSSSPSASALILETLVRSEYPMHELANRTQGERLFLIHHYWSIHKPLLS